ncbi:hypothetical protein [Micromonospora sp. NPDC047730]|uniref:hypothetical protein n=1 Tax=Micromonospora sp. NPDC047730 TaxID=3364253 RepID=UPI00371F5E48
MSMIDYAGQRRFVAGRIRYATAPEPGTILGPNATREHLVVLGQDGQDTLLGYATDEDRSLAFRHALLGPGPRSVTEFQMARG